MREAQSQYGRSDHEPTCTLATMWTFVTEDPGVRWERLAGLAEVVGRSPEELADRLLIGPAGACADLLRRYADAGVDRLCVWPLAEPERQLERVMAEVVPRV